MKLQQQTNSVFKKINIPQRINQINDIDSVIGAQRWEKVLEEVVVNGKLHWIKMLKNGENLHYLSKE